MEAEVVKSYGLSRIDREAMTLVQRAFPMPLDHVLDRQQIVMRIPSPIRATNRMVKSPPASFSLRSEA